MPRGANRLLPDELCDFCYVLAFLAQRVTPLASLWPKCGDRTFDIISSVFIIARRRKTNRGSSRICIAHTVILDCNFLRLQRSILNPNRSRHSILLLELLY